MSLLLFLCSFLGGLVVGGGIGYIIRMEQEYHKQLTNKFKKG